MFCFIGCLFGGGPLHGPPEWTRVIHSNAMLDQVDDALLGRRRHGGAQHSLAHAASHVGMGIDDKDNIVSHGILDLQCALLDRDARLTRIFPVNNKCPRIPNGPDLAFSSRLPFCSLDNDLALAKALCATRKDEFDALNILVANLDHRVCCLGMTKVVVTSQSCN
jgi:hypothetical protein